MHLALALLAPSCALGFQISSTPLPSKPFNVHPAIRRLPVSPRLPASRMGIFDEAAALPPTKVVDTLVQGGRFTPSDVSAQTGTSLDEASRYLRDLAALLGGEASLEVSSEGELIYSLPPDLSGRLAARSNAAALRAAVESAKPGLFTALRVAFGAALLVSIVAVWSAVFVISSSSSDDRDERRGGGMGGFGGPSFYFGPSPFDVFFYRPYYSYGNSNDGEMGFLEAVYSYVFGDGDPNIDLDERSVRAAARCIRQGGGAVTAGQLAPYLAPPDSDGLGDSNVVDESWVLPVLTRLNGVPQVTAQGDIVYVFDDMQVTAAADGASPEWAMDSEGVYLEEREIVFSQADDTKLFLAGALGAVNLAGVGYLGLQLSSLPPDLMLPGWLGLVQSLFPLLLTYAVSFNVAPAWRSLSNKAKNQAILQRNQARRESSMALQTRLAQEKIEAARGLGWGEVRRVAPEDVAYSTADDFQDTYKSNKQLEDLDNFDKNLQ